MKEHLPDFCTWHNHHANGQQDTKDLQYCITVRKQGQLTLRTQAFVLKKKCLQGHIFCLQGNLLTTENIFHFIANISENNTQKPSDATAFSPPPSKKSHSI